MTEPILTPTTVNVNPDTKGTMGLSGLWGLVGNSTAMLIVAVVMFLMIGQVREMHREGVGTLKDIIHTTVRGQTVVIQENTQAIKDLAREVKLSRQELSKDHK